MWHLPFYSLEYYNFMQVIHNVDNSTDITYTVSTSFGIISAR